MAIRRTKRTPTGSPTVRWFVLAVCALAAWVACSSPNSSNGPAEREETATPQGDARTAMPHAQAFPGAPAMGSMVARSAPITLSSGSRLSYGVQGQVNAIAVLGTDVYVGGNFTRACNNASCSQYVTARNIVRWDGSAWRALGTGAGVNGFVTALVVAGTNVYVGGNFSSICGNSNCTGGGTAAANIAVWDGNSWSAAGGGLNNTVQALVFDGRYVYAGGSFYNNPPSTVTFLASWDTAAGTPVWQGVGGGVGGTVYALALSSTDLYVGGSFTTVSTTVPARNIARWANGSWTALGAGPPQRVNALAIGAGGVFAGCNETTGPGLNQWGGSTWSAVGGGLDGAVNALAMLGNDLYVGGVFALGSGVGLNGVAKWDGTSFTGFASGVDQNGVSALAVQGSDVYLGGAFAYLCGNLACNAGNLQVNSVARAAPAAGVSTTSASSISSTSATLNGQVNANGSSDTVTFEWGSSPTTLTGTLTATPSTVSGASTTTVSAQVSALIPNTSYSYRVVATNSVGWTVRGSTVSFTSAPALAIMQASAATNVTSTSATLNGSANPQNSATAYGFAWGTTVGTYPNVLPVSTANGMSTVTFSTPVASLTPNTTYHYVAYGLNLAGAATSTDQTFTTSTAPPAITTSAASAITQTTATLNGSVNVWGLSTMVTFYYGTSSTLSSTTVTAPESPVTSATATAVTGPLTGLTASTTYYFQARALGLGGSAQGAVLSFTTLPIPSTGDAGADAATDSGTDAAGDSGSPDAAVDSGTVDSGTVDSGTVDSGTVDSGTVDSGTVDSGIVDAGRPDATTDSGTIDSGSIDSGRPDAAVDSGVTDAAADAANDSGDAGGASNADASDANAANPSNDAGRRDGGDAAADASEEGPIAVPPLKEGCGCRTSGTDTSGTPLALAGVALALVAVRRRTRRR